MFAARDQENLVHAHQTAAAAKPLNQGGRGLGNHAPKTPFKIPLNDENATARPAGKSVLRTHGKPDENRLFRGGKDDKQHAFVTPAGPRNRAPLGMKTTNAKAKPFQTPGAQKNEPTPVPAKTQQIQAPSRSPRLRRAKVKVHPETSEAKLEEDSEPEIEYMPPRGTPLPDDPDDWTPREYPQFAPGNLTRGYVSTYLDPIDDITGEPLSARRDAAQAAASAARDDAALEAAVTSSLDEIESDLRREFGLDVGNNTKPAVRKPTQTQKRVTPSAKAAVRPTTTATTAAQRPRPANPTSRASRAAATALAPGPRFATPTTAALARKGATSANVAPKDRVTEKSRHVAASAASRSTLGYGKGRAMAGAMRTGRESRQPTGDVARGRYGNEMSREMPGYNAQAAAEALSQLTLSDSGEDEIGEAWGGRGGVSLADEDALEDFVLELPAGLQD